MAPVIRALKKSRSLRPVVVTTGQHRTLLTKALQDVGIAPDYAFSVMVRNQTPAQVISSILKKLPPLLLSLAPSAVVVQGDTATICGAALAAFSSHVPVAHVEAGLRTRDLKQPWPEEAMRQLADRICTWHFAPTAVSRENLLAEGINQDSIYITGNTIVDQMFSMLPKLQTPEEVLERLRVTSKKYLLVTGHRRENHGKNFHDVARALKTIAQNHPDYTLIYPVHPNPNVRGPMKRDLGNVNGIRLIRPLPYSDFLALLTGCEFVISDSGGVQEEASVAGKRVVLLRDVTERPEGVQAGMTIPVGCDYEKIIDSVENLIKNGGVWTGGSLYGDGHAGENIVKILERTL